MFQVHGIYRVGTDRRRTITEWKTLTKAIQQRNILLRSPNVLQARIYMLVDAQQGKAYGKQAPQTRSTQPEYDVSTVFPSRD